MFSITRNFKFHVISADDYSHDVFDLRIPIPAFSFMGVPGILSFLWITFVMGFVRLARRDFFAEFSEIRVRNIVFPAVCRLLRLNIDVIDVRGILHDEAKLLGRSHLTVKFLYLLEAFSVRNSKKTTSPTASVGAYMRRRCPGSAVGLLEPFVASDRCKVNQRVLSEKALKAVYLGSLSPWNDYRRISAVLQNFKNIEMIQFVGTYSPFVEDFIRKQCVDKCHVNFTRVAHEEVFELLKKFDVGVIFGSKTVSSLTDRTMVPSKLYEYVEAGLTPLIPEKCKAARMYLKSNGVTYIEY